MNIENFYTPKDKLTTRYAKAMEKLDKLPASFYLENDDNPDSQGTPRQTTSFNDFSIEAGILLRGNGVPHAMLVIHIRA